MFQFVYNTFSPICIKKKKKILRFGSNSSSKTNMLKRMIKHTPINILKTVPKPFFILSRTVVSIPLV